MSKAFTKEDAPSGDNDDEESAAARRGSKYITEKGYRVLKKELDQLWQVERPKITQQVADAAAQGDRSENAEYIYGKRKLREIDRRIRFLSKRLEVLTVVVPNQAQHGKALFGAWVTLEDDNGEQVVYRLVGSDEFDPDRGWISIESPVAQAILSKEEGDEVLVRRPKGNRSFVIAHISYEGEDLR